MPEKRNIINGPDKSDLQTSFFNPKLKLDLEFLTQKRGPDQTGKLKINQKIKLGITQLQLEDGSGDCFNFFGFERNKSKKYKGFYSTKERKGSIEEVSK